MAGARANLVIKARDADDAAQTTARSEKSISEQPVLKKVVTPESTIAVMGLQECTLPPSSSPGPVVFYLHDDIRARDADYAAQVSARSENIETPFINSQFLRMLLSETGTAFAWEPLS